MNRAILHSLLALISVLPWLLAPWMEGTRERATLQGLEGPACPSRWLLPDVGCPGCGLTRAVVLAVHGSLESSLRLNIAGLFVLCLGPGAALVHGDIARQGRMHPSHALILRLGRVMLCCGVVLAYALRLLGFH